MEDSGPRIGLRTAFVRQNLGSPNLNAENQADIYQQLFKPSDRVGWDDPSYVAVRLIQNWAPYFTALALKDPQCPSD